MFHVIFLSKSIFNNSHRLFCVLSSGMEFGFDLKFFFVVAVNLSPTPPTTSTRTKTCRRFQPQRRTSPHLRWSASKKTGKDRSESWHRYSIKATRTTNRKRKSRTCLWLGPRRRAIYCRYFLRRKIRSIFWRIRQLCRRLWNRYRRRQRRNYRVATVSFRDQSRGHQFRRRLHQLVLPNVEKSTKTATTVTMTTSPFSL